MPKVKSPVLVGENGAPYRLRPGKEDNPPDRAYLSKDGVSKEMELVNNILNGGAAPLSLNSRGEVQQNLSQRNAFGGVAPPGYGEHPHEMILWTTPVFRVHPISQRLEAINGLFFRLWPEHVKILQKMKIEGWPHVEIVAVSKELRRRQDEQFQRDEQMAQQHLAMAQADKDKEAAEIHGFRPEDVAMMRQGMGPDMSNSPPPGMEGPPPGMEGPPPGMEGPPLARSLSLSIDDDYIDKLENFRGRFYSRDGFNNMRSMTRQTGKKKSGDLVKRKEPVEEGKGFGVIVKNAFDFVSEETLSDRKRDKDRSFTTRQSGVNGPTSEDVEDVDDQGVIPGGIV